MPKVMLKDRLVDGAARTDNWTTGLTVPECRQLLSLLAAAEYAAGSFAQVPEDKTVPPIVLHDCRKHLEVAIAAVVN